MLEFCFSILFFGEKCHLLKHYLSSALLVFYVSYDSVPQTCSQLEGGRFTLIHGIVTGVRTAIGAEGADGSKLGHQRVRQLMIFAFALSADKLPSWLVSFTSYASRFELPFFLVITVLILTVLYPEKLKIA